MNAIVEVATAEAVAQVSEATVITLSRSLPVKVTTPVATSTLHAVLSQGNHSISAVAPDAIFYEGALAKA